MGLRWWESKELCVTDSVCVANPHYTISNSDKRNKINHIRFSLIFSSHLKMVFRLTPNL